MNDLISNFADEVRQYILDVLSGEKETEDKCLDNYAKAVRKYVELANKSEDDVTEEELNQIEKFLEDATIHINCGFGELIDNAISQLKSEVEELKTSIKQKKITKMKTKKFTIAIAMMLLTIGQVYSQERLTITNEKPGKLRKQLPNKSKNDLKELVVYGSINGKDLLEIYKLPNLKSLDLSNAVLQDLSEINEIASIDYWERRGVFYLPETISYDTLKLPKDNWMIVPSVSKIGKYGDERRIGHLWMYPGYDGETLGKKNYTTISNLTYKLHFYQYSTRDRQDLDMSKAGMYDVGFLELGIYDNLQDNHYCLAKALEKDDGSISGMLQSGRHCIYDYPLFRAVYVPSRSVLGNLGLTTLNTLMAIVEDEKDTTIVFYPFADTILDIKRKLTLAPFAFSTNNHIRQANMNGVIRDIPKACFWGCLNLESVNLLGVKTIGAYAFSNTNIHKISIPASVKVLDCNAFLNSGIDTIVFEGKMPPILANWEEETKPVQSGAFHFEPELLTQWKKYTIIVPDEALQYYSSGLWEDLGVTSINAKQEQEITITEPGTLAIYLDGDILKRAKGLKIKGWLYDTDISILNKCERLTSLDLSMCFISENPEKKKRIAEERAAEAALLGYIGQIASESAEHEYEVGNMELGEAAKNVIVGQYLQKLAKDAENQTITVNNECLSPELSIYSLRKYRMPLQASTIYASGLHNLTELICPPNATTIGSAAFSYTGKLRTMKFPPSITTIEYGAFYGCSLEEIDLSETSVKGYNGYCSSNNGFYGVFQNNVFSSIEDCPVKVIKFPKGLKRWSGSVDFGTELYFYSNQPPQGICLSQPASSGSRKIHIPKGCLSGWAGVSSSGLTVVDDIDCSPTIIDDNSANYVSLLTGKNMCVVSFDKGKIFFGYVEEGEEIGSLVGDKMNVGEESYIIQGTSILNSKNQVVASIEGNKLKGGNVQGARNKKYIIEGTKIMSDDGRDLLFKFSNRPSIKELLASFIFILKYRR